MIVNGPDTAAVVALNAIGQQDTYLTRDDPGYSFFKYETKTAFKFYKVS